MLFHQRKEPIFGRRLSPNGLVTHESEATNRQYDDAVDCEPTHQPPKFRIRENRRVLFSTDFRFVWGSFFLHVDHSSEGCRIGIGSGKGNVLTLRYMAGRSELKIALAEAVLQN
jgi:hypothetical protein